KGIEPSYAAWEAAVLPLNYAREIATRSYHWSGFGRPQPRHESRRKTCAAPSHLEVLAELQALRLIVRPDAHAIERVGPRQHPLEYQAADDLAVLQDERHLARTHLQHRAGTLPTRTGVAKTGVEEARIVHAEFADQRIEWHHLGRVVGRHLHCFFGRE